MSEKSPSQKRYEEKNPTVSFRVTQKVKEKFNQLAEQSSLSKKELFTQFVMQENKTYEKGYKDGFEIGSGNGFEDAREYFEVKYPCNRCGKPITVDTKKEKDQIWRILEASKEWNWAHQECIHSKRR